MPPKRENSKEKLREDSISPPKRKNSPKYRVSEDAVAVKSKNYLETEFSSKVESLLIRFVLDFIDVFIVEQRAIIRTEFVLEGDGDKEHKALELVKQNILQLKMLLKEDFKGINEENLGYYLTAHTNFLTRVTDPTRVNHFNKKLWDIIDGFTKEHGTGQVFKTKQEIYTSVMKQFQTNFEGHLSRLMTSIPEHANSGHIAYLKIIANMHSQPFEMIKDTDLQDDVVRQEESIQTMVKQLCVKLEERDREALVMYIRTNYPYLHTDSETIHDTIRPLHDFVSFEEAKRYTDEHFPSRMKRLNKHYKNFLSCGLAEGRLRMSSPDISEEKKLMTKEDIYLELQVLRTTCGSQKLRSRSLKERHHESNPTDGRDLLPMPLVRVYRARSVSPPQEEMQQEGGVHLDRLIESSELLSNETLIQ